MTSAESRPWVVDASVAFAWFAEVPGSERAVALLEAAPPVLSVVNPTAPFAALESA